MMKRFLLMCGLAMAAMTMPLAANYCGNECVADPCCDDVGFEGFYIGGNLGVFTHTAFRNDFDGFLVDNSGWAFNHTDVTVGIQLGYDWLCCYKLFGLVVDWNWVNVDHCNNVNPDEDDGIFVRNGFNWFTTIRARAGLAVADALVYVTAGAAVSSHDNRWADGADIFDHNHTRWGWVGGVGTELILGCNWSVGLEVLFLQFAQRSRTFVADDESFIFGHSDAGYVARFLLNYRFGDLCGCW